MQSSTSTSNMLVRTQPLLVVQSMIHTVANPEVFIVSPDGDGLSSDCGGQEVGG